MTLARCKIKWPPNLLSSNPQVSTNIGMTGISRIFQLTSLEIGFQTSGAIALDEVDDIVDANETM